MLAVPASALALSDSTGSDTQNTTPLPARVTPRHLRLGAPVHVTGHLSPRQAGRTVVLEAARSAHGRWRRLASTRIGRHGGYVLRVSPSRSGVVRAVEVAPAITHVSAPRSAGTSTPAAAAAPTAPTPAVSRVAEVQVKAAVHVSRGEHDVVAGGSVDVAGRLLPGRGGRTVAVQHRVADGWRTLARGRTGGHGGFAVRVRPGTLTHSRLRVLFTGDRLNARATAGAGALVVYEPVVASWYDDAAETACGFHAGYGVANKSLPCGTKVRLRRGDRTVTATVDDRGPYVEGRDYDLDEATAAALGFSGVGTIDASVE